MIVLNALPSSFSDKLTFLDFSDVPALTIVIIFLFIAYYKVKFAKKEPQPQSHSRDQNAEVNVDSYDVLMQPKKQYNGSLKPLLNFTLPITASELLLTFILIVFYYFLFTEVL
jgi:hypothetical protein